MDFISDKQTTEELNLLGKYQLGSVYSLFNKVKTSGAERLLETMLRNPFSDAQSINQRSAVFRHFQQAAYSFPFEQETVSTFANWLDQGGSRSLAGVVISASGKMMLSGLIRDERYGQMEAGVRAAAQVIVSGHAFLSFVQNPNPYEHRIKEIQEILSDKRLKKLSQFVKAPKITLKETAYYDHLLKSTLGKEMGTFLAFIFEVDVYIAVGGVAKARDFCYATAEEKNGNHLKLKGLKHPSLERAVGNDLALDGSSNILFLTGANMAGKSTLMKSIGIALYLAQAGFPVAAEQMSFSIKDGLYSSINVPDNISLGYSHFYTEVLRVKQAAELVAQRKNMLVMFDELFKGTNVKDAYEGTLEVTKAFAGYHNCLFIISTHIIEVGEVLRQEAGRVQFRYMPTVMEGNRPRYTYHLTEGITSDRQGMMIIENERILKLLE
jgi:DNA mismatch repair protein MutS